MLSPNVKNLQTAVILQKQFIRRFCFHQSDCAIAVAIRHPHRVLTHEPECTCGFFDEKQALDRIVSEYQTR